MVMRDVNVTWTTCESPVGTLTLTATHRGLSGLHFPGRRRSLDPSAHRPDVLEPVVAQLDEYFAGTRRSFDVTVDLESGSPFEQDVWHELLTIPYGTTTSYGDLARRLGRLDRVRAVAAAIGRNPVAIIVPCHRVIGADGSLTGFGGGLPRKRLLLDTESSQLALL